MEIDATEPEVHDLTDPSVGALLDRVGDPRAEPGVRHLSPSSASAYSQCARRWKFRYLDRLPDPPGPAALAGTFAHRVLELLLQEDPQHRTKDRAKELARQAWPETAEDDDFIALALDDTAAREFRWKGWQAIEGLWHLEDPTTVDVVATEQRVDTMIGGVPFRGIVDRVDLEDGRATITDYKSGRAPTMRYREARLAQVLLYAAAIAEESGALPAKAKLLYLGQKVVETDVDPESVEAVTNDLATTWANVQSDCASGEFEPTTGPLCAWCPYAEQCPEGMAEVRRRHKAGRVRLDSPVVVKLLAATA